MDKKFKIPDKIKSKIRNKNIITIIIGLILCCGLYMITQGKFSFPELIIGRLNVINVFTYVSLIITVISLIIFPLYFLLFRPDVKKAEKRMKEIGCITEDLLADFENSKPIKRIRSGKLFTYYFNIYSLSIIPNSYVAWVYKRIKTIKRKMTEQTRTGYVKKVRYTISTTYKYYVIIKTLDKKTITIPCQKENSADNIIQYYSDTTNAIIGAGSANKKLYGKRVWAYKENLKNKKQ